MEIIRTSILSGITRTRNLDITEEQIKAHEAGEYIQVAMSNLSASDREFYMTGITDEEWNEPFLDVEE